MKPNLISNSFDAFSNKNSPKFKIVKQYNILYYHILKFNPLNFSSLSPCTIKGDDGILPIEMEIAKTILVGITNSQVDIIIIICKTIVKIIEKNWLSNNYKNI